MQVIQWEKANNHHGCAIDSRVQPVESFPLGEPQLMIGAEEVCKEQRRPPKSEAAKSEAV